MTATASSTAILRIEPGAELTKILYLMEQGRKDFLEHTHKRLLLHTSSDGPTRTLPLGLVPALSKTRPLVSLTASSLSRS